MTRDWITVVSGLPRSGTSMMMRMIEAGGIPPLTDRLRTADEDNPHGYYEFEPVKRTRENPSWVEQAVGKAVKVIHVLLPHLPAGRPYRVVLMERDLGEVLRSQETMLLRGGKKAASSETLRRAFLAQLEQLERWFASRPEVRLLRVSHRTVIENPRGEAERVAGFLECGEAAETMALAVDPALYRQREE
jgi:hypothetical protein